MPLHLPVNLRRRLFYITAAAVLVSGVGAAVKPTPETTSGERSAAGAKSAAAATVDSTDTVGAEATLLAAVPAAAAAKSEPEEADEAEPQPKVTTYTVEAGDTIEGIATRFGLETETLLMVNDLYADDLLQIGQELQIPAMDALVYEVAEGDTLWGVADAFDADFHEIVSANPDINADALQPGDILLVPGGTPPSRQRTMVASRGGGRSPAASGTLAWPAYAELTDWFGGRVHPVLGYWHMHDGIDIGVGWGTPVGAAAPGTVTHAGWDGGYGITVQIDHGDGVVTMYAHLSEVAVGYGDWVDTGDLIGYSGDTGNSTGPHLHFSVIVWGTPVDPLDWLP